MFDIFNSVKGFIKLNPISIDNGVFKLHYKATFVILLTCSLLITASQYVGDPIDCVVDAEDLESDDDQAIMDTYCWIHSTYSVFNKQWHGTIGFDYAHPGVMPNPGSMSNAAEIKHHKYYQWVCFTLFFQALLFYTPHYLWKLKEGGKMKALVQGLNVPIVSEDVKEKKIHELVSYFNQNRGGHTGYALVFFLCELLNLINVIGQIFLIDRFLGGEFMEYGLNVANMSEMNHEQRNDAMSKVFPKVTKCVFHRFGPSGTIENIDGMCILPLNIINEKIYIFLWFWLIILAVITAVSVFYRVMVFAIGGLQETLLANRARPTNRGIVRVVNTALSLGDWFVIYQLGKNMDKMLFKTFLTAYCSSLAFPTKTNDIKENDFHKPLLSESEKSSPLLTIKDSAEV